MKFRPGKPCDAEAIAALVASFQGEITDNPGGAGAEEYLASVSIQAERRYLESPLPMRLAPAKNDRAGRQVTEKSGNMGYT